MPSEMAIGDVMTPSPLSVNPEEKLLAAQQLMNDNRIRHLPVVDDGKPVSVISERDVNVAVSVHTHSKELEELTVADIAGSNLYQVEIDTSLSEVASHMAEHAIGSVIITRDGLLDGIFTATDACKYLSMCLHGAFSSNG